MVIRHMNMERCEKDGGDRMLEFIHSCLEMLSKWPDHSSNRHDKYAALWFQGTLSMVISAANELGDKSIIKQVDDLIKKAGLKDVDEMNTQQEVSAVEKLIESTVKRIKASISSKI